ncbi:tyrosyl-tRNA synthetase [Cronobacter phage vB_CsaM_GAP32]|uniref:tyrosine--tRNA ligase n=1 Tax=Cronobacter phage vB_CsaM_GAP32 TaxID=1141136 RepID=K4F5T3_9CAUD|nr:tyrosyl-tRNA synthetase [Cronobacter phage vB_CsaM_GAP32]AFC21581.1 tyrosyl-tRNA synthetase [Cronobacter phage vB_CsaM_GAP32]
MHSALVELQERGLIKQSTDIEVLSKLLDEGSAVYCGFDPTADSLHIGSLLPLTIMNVFKKHGVKVIALLGGATGSIGDPSFKSEERKMLSWDDIDRNVAGIRAVIKSILGDVEIVNNYSWTKDINMLEFLRDYGKCFTVNNMMNKESVRSRIERDEQGISFTEFSYQILQAMDFEYLYEMNNCKIQIGGSDQWGNMIAGIDLIHKIHGNDADCGVITIPLVTKSDGTKFGKSESGTIWLTEQRTTPYHFFQFWRNLDDAEIPKLYQYFKPFSFSVDDIVSEMTNGDPNIVKLQFAIAMTEMVHGEHKASLARDITDFLHGKKEITEEAVEMMIKSGFDVDESTDNLELVSLVVSTGLADSRKMAREFINNGAVKINGRKVNEFYDTANCEFTEDVDFVDAKHFVLQRGKNTYVVVKNTRR